jgi:hypothetical protein
MEESTRWKLLSESMQNDLKQHMEEMACAYALKCNISPDQAVMNIYNDYSNPNGMVTKVWFTTKKEEHIDG